MPPPPRRVILIQPPAPPVPPEDPSIREHDRLEGVTQFYIHHGATYRNPHTPQVQDAMRVALSWGVPLDQILDLGCGSGEIYEVLLAAGIAPDRIDPCDPWTGAAFLARTGRPVLPWSFADILAGALGDRRYTTVIASYSLHLCPDSMLPPLLDTLARHTSNLLLLSPHKRPHLDAPRRFTLRRADHTPGRVRLRWYTCPTP